jgi:hypothetical protein
LQQCFCFVRVSAVWYFTVESGIKHHKTNQQPIFSYLKIKGIYIINRLHARDHFIFFLGNELCSSLEDLTVDILVSVLLSTYLASSDYRIENYCLVRKDVDVNEHERLSNITLRHKLN